VVDMVEKAASLHDIGKIAIPTAVLQKPGPLDDEEWKLMRRHTLIGQRIIGVAPALGSVAEIVRASHERLDGQGYPDGLSGNEIPLAARIIFVCDSFDAMCSVRPYQETRSASEALAELRRCAGTRYDPAVVEALAAELAATEEETTVSARLGPHDAGGYSISPSRIASATAAARSETPSLP
jgi:HD-GYP domain-containing protein (c-di-GMP phosphodiesterase class II)